MVGSLQKSIRKEDYFIQTSHMQNAQPDDEDPDVKEQLSKLDCQPIASPVNQYTPQTGQDSKIKIEIHGIPLKDEEEMKHSIMTPNENTSHVQLLSPTSGMSDGSAIQGMIKGSVSISSSTSKEGPPPSFMQMEDVTMGGSKKADATQVTNPDSTNVSSSKMVDYTNDSFQNNSNL